MSDPDNAAAAAPETSTATAQNPLEGAAAGDDGGSQNPLEAAASVSSNEGIEIPEKFRNEDGSVNSDDLLKSYTELEREYSTRPQVPKTVEDYNIDYGDLPEGVEINKDSEAALLKECHELGVSNKVAEFFLKKHIADKVASAEDASGKTDCVIELKESWGKDYAKNAKDALKGYNALAPKDVLADPTNLNRVGNNALMVRLLAEAGKNLSEDVLNNAAIAGESQMDIDSLMRSEAYRDSKHPENAKTKERVSNFFKKKYPEAR